MNARGRVLHDLENLPVPVGVQRVAFCEAELFETRAAVLHGEMFSGVCLDQRPQVHDLVVVGVDDVDADSVLRSVLRSA